MNSFLFVFHSLQQQNSTSVSKMHSPNPCASLRLHEIRTLVVVSHVTSVTPFLLTLIYWLLTIQAEENWSIWTDTLFSWLYLILLQPRFYEKTSCNTSQKCKDYNAWHMWQHILGVTCGKRYTYTPLSQLSLTYGHLYFSFIHKHFNHSSP